MNRGPYRAELLTGRDALAATRADHETLFARAAAGNPFLSPLWVHAWLEEVGHLNYPVALTLRDEDGQLAAFWPFIEFPALGGQGLWPLASDIANCMEPLVDPADPDLPAAVLSHLPLLLENHRYLWLPLFRQDWTDRWLRPALETFPNLHLLRPRNKTFYTNLGGRTWDDFLQATLGPKSRKSLRYDVKQLSQQGDILHRICANSDETATLLPELESIERISWKGASDQRHLSHPRLEKFYRHLLPELVAAGQARVSTLTLDQMAIAFEIGLLAPNYYGLFHVAYLPDHKKHSPGRQLFLRNLEHCHTEGRHHYDFQQGVYPYKERFADKTMPLHDVLICQRTLHGRLNYWLTRLVSRRARR